MWNWSHTGFKLTLGSAQVSIDLLSYIVVVSDDVIMCSVNRPYQLDASEAADSQRVDDVEVCQLQTGEEGVLRLVSGSTKHGDAFTEQRKISLETFLGRSDGAAEQMQV